MSSQGWFDHPAVVAGDAHPKCMVDLCHWPGIPDLDELTKKGYEVNDSARRSSMQYRPCVGPECATIVSYSELYIDYDLDLPRDSYSGDYIDHRRLDWCSLECLDRWIGRQARLGGGDESWLDPEILELRAIISPIVREHIAIAGISSGEWFAPVPWALEELLPPPVTPQMIMEAIASRRGPSISPKSTAKNATLDGGIITKKKADRLRLGAHLEWQVKRELELDELRDGTKFVEHLSRIFPDRELDGLTHLEIEFAVRDWFDRASASPMREATGDVVTSRENHPSHVRACAKGHVQVHLNACGVGLCIPDMSKQAGRKTRRLLAAVDLLSAGRTSSNLDGTPRIITLTVPNSDHLD